MVPFKQKPILSGLAWSSSDLVQCKLTSKRSLKVDRELARDMQKPRKIRERKEAVTLYIPYNFDKKPPPENEPPKSQNQISFQLYALLKISPWPVTVCCFRLFFFSVLNCFIAKHNPL